MVHDGTDPGQPLLLGMGSGNGGEDARLPRLVTRVCVESSRMQRRAALGCHAAEGTHTPVLSLSEGIRECMGGPGTPCKHTPHLDGLQLCVAGTQLRLHALELTLLGGNLVLPELVLLPCSRIRDHQPIQLGFL